MDRILRYFFDRPTPQTSNQTHTTTKSLAYTHVETKGEIKWEREAHVMHHNAIH